MKKTGMSKIIEGIEESLVILKNRMEDGDNPEGTNYQKIIDKCKKHNITNRQKEILFKVLEGNEYKQIAADLKISINTVDKHIQQLHKKFHVQSNIELILLLK
jgi:DNA-binding NarL/FixJ family response regulator